LLGWSRVASAIRLDGFGYDKFDPSYKTAAIFGSSLLDLSSSQKPVSTGVGEDVPQLGLAGTVISHEGMQTEET
jgi:hypothetical protein